MKSYSKKSLYIGVSFITLFSLWTILIQTIDVEPVGLNNSNVGFATFNLWFHRLTSVNLSIYNITDWLGLVPIFICIIFAVLGLFQLIKRKSLFKVDIDIIILGVYYIIVVLGYLIFEIIPINYRPITINGFVEASYPSSTTLLVLSVMPTLVFQIYQRINSLTIKRLVFIFSVVFSAFMVIGRLVSGVHWFTDIIGSVLLSTGLFYIYNGMVLLSVKINK